MTHNGTKIYNCCQKICRRLMKTCFLSIRKRPNICLLFPSLLSTLFSPEIADMIVLIMCTSCNFSATSDMPPIFLDRLCVCCCLGCVPALFYYIPYTHTRQHMHGQMGPPRCSCPTTFLSLSQPLFGIGVDGRWQSYSRSHSSLSLASFSLFYFCLPIRSHISLWSIPFLRNGVCL